MAYSGFLVKIGDYTIPNNVIKYKTYKAYRNVLDLDSYEDGNGELHRNALEHVRYKCEFNLKPMYNTEWNTIMSNIRANYTVELERKGIVTMYIPEYDEYATQNAYMVEPQPTMYSADDVCILYDECRISFIGY